MSWSEVAIRVAGMADLDGVIALERRTAEAPHWAAGEYVGMLEGGSGAVRRCLLVAEMEDVLAGFAVGKVAGADGERVGEIESVAVDAARRRGGVGRALCGAVIAWCDGEGAAAIELEVRAGSAGAIALYRGLGFVEVGRRKGYYRDPEEDALLMERRLEAC
jgi:ribosomal-protein-alanine N-acetyltransferase